MAALSGLGSRAPCDAPASQPGSMACAAPVDERAWFARAAAAAREASGAASACELRPLAFFVAWGGVLTLVYEGFPEPLVALKGALEAGDLPLRKDREVAEDHAWGPRGRRPRADLGAAGVAARPVPGARCALPARRRRINCRVAVRELAAVRYRRRGLEPPVEDRVAVPLGAAAPPDGTGASAPGAQAPPAEEAARVRGVLAGWGDLEAYLPLVNQPGSRIGSYRDGSPSGACLVAFLGAGPPLREVHGQI
ncbi:unnamed protein product [Prorocentrum cordatum]|uniref:Uncharacterized protein n=2 Tax=Prorocentrum cordatum TaxID=2364126 RepID=A0ABN9XGM5_9DINO|nr:unnamed protein product [Polarella glacialis]